MDTPESKLPAVFKNSTDRLRDRLLRWVITASFASLLLCGASPALAQKTCPTEQDRAVLTKFGDRIASQATTGEAQELAMSKLRVGHKALNRARGILPGRATALDEAEVRLDALEAAVMAGTTPAEVAAPLQRMAALDGRRCEYDTVEIVVIVVGFVLGILPGVLFLFLFC